MNSIAPSWFPRLSRCDNRATRSAFSLNMRLSKRSHCLRFAETRRVGPWPTIHKKPPRRRTEASHRGIGEVEAESWNRGPGAHPTLLFANTRAVTACYSDHRGLLDIASARRVSLIYLLSRLARRLAKASRVPPPIAPNKKKPIHLP